MGQAGMKNNWKRNTRYMGVFAVLAAVFCMIVVLNINTGNVQISVPEILRILFLKKGTQVQMNIIWKIRLPRVLMAGILGGALALSGFLLQTFFSNPIAGPYVLGISSGAKMMVALAMIIFLKYYTLVSSYILIIAAFIFVIALFGTNVVRKCASTLSVLIIIGLVLVLVPNIIAQWGDITASIHTMSSGEMTVLSSESGAFGPALYSAVLYFFFQLASVSVMYQHMEDVTDEKQINKAAIWMFVCNFCAMELSILGLLAIAYVSELASASVPMLVLVQNGVGAGILTPIISLLIILGAISTAVNMISGIVTRCVNAVERRMDSPEKKAQGHLGRNAVFTAIFTFLAFAIAQFGLMTVVKKGYAYLGYAAFITLFVPFVVHAVATKGKEI